MAWTQDGMRILAVGRTPQEARKAAVAHGAKIVADWVPEKGIAYEWVPPAGERFIGTVRP